ncbi:MAG: glycine--tRNA ligase subunit beta [Bryobacteraceae bacterium]
MSDFLLEIGTEEIPHWMVPGALEQMAKWDLFGAKLNVDATSRRLTIWATGLPERTADSEQVLKGPPLASGDKAAEGFAKKQGADISALRKVGNYYELVKKVEGRATRDILAETLPAMILGLQWPKTMYWTGGKTGPRFIRPIRWLVALLGDQVIPFEIAGVKSSNITRGHRILGSSSIPVTTANYEAELRKNFVILSSTERRKKIETEAIALGAKIDPELRETLTFITECPSVIRGDFNPDYLTLPAEVLIEVMRYHQKYFAVETAPGKLAPHFVAVLNTNDDPEGFIKHGNERVLKARFNDARFFWDVDQQKKLADRVDDLAKVTFQAKLGSYKEKADRTVALVKELGGDQDAQRAALLAKCDLTTDMVKEFTDLQGIVGGLYARAQGENESVAQAIYEHYKPLSMDDSIPATRNGQLLALADKLDTLRGCFNVGLIPSGSKDPFALRRAAQGVVKILVEAKFTYKLEDLCTGDLQAFMLERVQYYFREIRGFKYDEVNAVMKVGVSTLRDLEDRLTQIARVRSTPDFEPLAASFKRMNNILKQANVVPGVLHVNLLEPGPEKELYDAYWDRAFNSLEEVAQLRPYVDRYFDSIMVNVPDEEIRVNRLTMLANMLKRFSTIADFSEIVTSGDQK